MSSATQEAVTSPGVVGHLIGGERVEGGSRVTPVYNPATGQITREAQVADAATIERAVSVAADAASETCTHPVPLQGAAREE